MIDEKTREILLKSAKSVLENAYAPYSMVQVAAAVLGGDGQIYTGVNVENSSLGLTVCAERNAVGAMIANGCREIRAVLLISSEGAIPPCGACRQVIMEFATDDTLVLLAGESGIIEEYTLEELYPRIFNLGELFDG